MPPIRRQTVALALALAWGAAALGAWRVGPASGGLEYPARGVVTSGPAGAFSSFCAVRIDAVDEGVRFLHGQPTTAAGGWSIDIVGAPEPTGPRFRMRVDDGRGGTTERTSAAGASAGAWQTVGASYAWDGLGGGALNLYVDGAGGTTGDGASAFLPPAPRTGYTIGDDPNVLGATARLGYVAVWDGVALDAADHAQLAAGADPRTIRADALRFFAPLEDLSAIDEISLASPANGPGAVFDTDRWPGARPFVSSLGHVMPTSIRVVSHAGRVATHEIEYGTGGVLDQVSGGVTSEASRDFVVAHELTGLAPATTYAYRVRIDGIPVPGSDGTFRTAPATETTNYRFIYSSCTEYDVNSLALGYPRYSHRTFQGMAARDPDFAVHSGDVWYSDAGGADAETPFNAWQLNTVEAFNRKAMQIMQERDFARFLRHVPLYMMPDDHEFTNNVGITARSALPTSRWQRALGRVLNWQFQSNPPRLPGAIERDGLWYTFTYGGVDFFFIDMRTQRGATGTGTMLGNTPGAEDGQLEDLLAWLDASTARFKVILAPSLLSDYGTTGGDAWHVKYPADQAHVIDELRRRQDVVYLAGDVHWSGAIRMSPSPDGDPAHDLYEFVGGTFGGHLSPPPTSGADDLLFVYDGRLAAPDRYSYLVVDVDTASVPAEMHVSIVSHDPTTGAETVEYAHPPILSRAHCRFDLDADDRVGFTDLLQLLSAWGVCSACPEDLDLSDDVGFDDLLSLLGAWGDCGSPR